MPIGGPRAVRSSFPAPAICYRRKLNHLTLAHLKAYGVGVSWQPRPNYGRNTNAYPTKQLRAKNCASGSYLMPLGQIEDLLEGGEGVHATDGVFLGISQMVVGGNHDAESLIIDRLIDMDLLILRSRRGWLLVM